MGSINRYIFRTTFAAFVIVLVSLTAVIWVTQALRDIDIMTSQGQNLLVFVGITGLIVPLLILVIAPIAMLIAVAHVLNKLSNDSEIIVMNSAGISPWALFRAFVPVTVVVSLLVLAISAYFAPKGLRMLRDWLTEVRANVVTNIVQPGRFSTIENGVTIRVRERRNNGQLLGIFLDDRRDPAERVTVLAETGELLDNDKGTFLVLQKGMVQRQQAERARPGDGRLRPLCLRSLAIRRRPAGGEIFDPRTLFVAAPVPRPQGSSSTPSSPDNSAPNCSTA